MKPLYSPVIVDLIQRLDEAARMTDVNTLTGRIKEELQRASDRAASALPGRFGQACKDSYARRLLHRDPALAYTMVVMTWGPQQRTELHDHAGIWCVECVLQGELSVTQYDLVEREGDRCRFDERSRVQAVVGQAGCLIPPFEYHVLANAGADTAITLHVYGGELDHCNCYQAVGDGWWQKSAKRLGYDA